MTLENIITLISFTFRPLPVIVPLALIFVVVTVIARRRQSKHYKQIRTIAAILVLAVALPFVLFLSTISIAAILSLLFNN